MNDLVLFCDHAIERAWQHLGMAPSRAEQRRLFLAIVDGGDVLLMRRQPHGREVYAAEIHGIPARLVYDPRTALVVTVLPGFASDRARTTHHAS